MITKGPREKLIEQGSDMLSDVELLAIFLIKSKTKKVPINALMIPITNLCNKAKLIVS